MDRAILPVFAGMIPHTLDARQMLENSPRIRGDDPATNAALFWWRTFSPYSRG